VGIATTGFRYPGGIRRIHLQQRSNQIREENCWQPISNRIHLGRAKEKTGEKISDKIAKSSAARERNLDEFCPTPTRFIGL
jgi:hypothetical protein